MLYKELRPLKEDYETIVVSVTEIEKALNPSQFVCKDPKKMANIFWVGSLVEDIVFATISKWKEFWLEQCQIARKYMDKQRMHYYTSSWNEDKQMQFLYDWLEQIVEYTRPFEAQYDLRNFRMLCELDCSSYKVILSWELDWGMDWYAIWDCKTAWTKWKEDERWNNLCYQWRFYPFMQMLAHPETNEMSFNYWVFTKQKKIQFQRIEHIVTREECERFVKEKIYEYLKWLKEWTLKNDTTVLERM